MECCTKSGFAQQKQQHQRQRKRLILSNDAWCALFLFVLKLPTQEEEIPFRIAIAHTHHNAYVSACTFEITNCFTYFVSGFCSKCHCVIYFLSLKSTATIAQNYSDFHAIFGLCVFSLPLSLSHTLCLAMSGCSQMYAFLCVLANCNCSCNSYFPVYITCTHLFKSIWMKSETKRYKMNAFAHTHSSSNSSSSKCEKATHVHIKQTNKPGNAFANSNQLFEKLLIKPFVVYKMQYDGIMQRKSCNWQLVGKTARTATKTAAALAVAVAAQAATSCVWNIF